MDDRVAANRRFWEELADLHPDTEFYDAEAVVGGASSLRGIEREELPSLDGRDVLHLQCHIGLDSVSLAREGADVTAVDYSERAIDTARELAAAAGADVEFVETDVRDVPGVVDREFDLVFASYGVLTWVPDVGEWAAVAAGMLRPGGALYLVDYHPFTDVLDREGRRPEADYFGDEPLALEEEGSYAAPEGEVTHTSTYQWTHGLGEVVTAVADAGLSLAFLHEFPYAYFRRFEGMVEDEAGRWRFEDDPQLPQLFSLLARA
ncbi:MAG: class I SAM-dependent methyltransferase [Halobacteriales archaeon]